jgi:hypothetical protein
MCLLFKMDFAGKKNAPAANQDLSIEVHISGWEDHQNGLKCGDDAFHEFVNVDHQK